MYPVLARCPVCSGELFAERLACVQCGTAIEGNFSLQRMSRLTPEQWAFVELFVRSEGKLNRMQEELNLSYPTVRNRLNDVIRALGYEVSDSQDEEENAVERQAVLEALSLGNIDIDEAIRLLKRGA